MTIVIGRQSELARIDTYLAGVPAGPRVLLIEGEPGVGKTTLWLAGLERADRAWRILVARPTDAEASFAYAGIGDLLEGIDDGVLAALPSPQQRALRVALLREEPEGRAPDPRAVAVAFLNALRGLARAQPTLIAVDDVQWLDPPSALVLGFAIRRLGDDPIGVVAARRIEGLADLPLGLDRPLAGKSLERIAVGPLGFAALAEILHTRLGATLPRAALHRIHATSGGNPLFALELGRALVLEPTRFDAGVDLPLPDELASLLGDQLARLPAETQDALGVVAALAYPTVELLARAIESPVERSLEPAIRGHLIEIDDGRIRFTHPLRAWVARSRTPPARRCEIHARLAAIVADPEERARHLALAADGPDEAAAVVLEEAARGARARGAPDTASELAAMAGRLTPPDRLDNVRRRGLAEAEYAMFAGDPVRARSLVDNLLDACPPGSARGEALSLLGRVYQRLDLNASVAALRQAMVEAGEDDRLRMRCEHWLAGALDLLGEDVAEVGLHVGEMLKLAERLGDDAGVAMALGFVAQNEQRRTGRARSELVDRVLALEPAMRDQVAVTNWPSRGLAEMLSWTDDLAAALERFDWFCQQAAERGEEASLIVYLVEMIPLECIAGAWGQALAHAEEAHELAVETGQILFRAAAVADRAFVEAHLGDSAAVRRDAEEALRLGSSVNARMAERMAAWGLGLLELSLGNPGRAHEQLGPLVEGRRAAGVGEPGDMRFVPDEIEALIGIGRLAEAKGRLDWYNGLATASGREFAIAACGRCRGLLHAARGELDAAISALEESRTRYATITDPFGLGRTLLALGSIQRRALRRRAARGSLEAALEVFERLGARLWADASRAELARIGGRRSAGDVLTASERAVAALVAEGRTNREVAAALVLTERTIEGHLSNIYAKLGVRSRSELARRLPAEPDRPHS